MAKRIQVAQLQLGSEPGADNTHRLYLTFVVTSYDGEHDLAKAVRDALRDAFVQSNNPLALLLGGSSENFEKRFSFGRLADEDDLRMDGHRVAGQIWKVDHFGTVFDHTQGCKTRLDKRRGREKDHREYETHSPVPIPGYEGVFKVSVNLSDLKLKVEAIPEGKAIGDAGWKTDLLQASLRCKLWLNPPQPDPES